MLDVFSNSKFEVRVPVCPNGLNAMQYSDGRPVMCLPGLDQCPDKSVCFYNGLDFFCCPNEDDPYDHHIFGGRLIYSYFSINFRL